jgi:transposase
MLSISANVRLFLCQVPTSMRKSFEGLSTVVEQLFPGELLSGAFFIFLSRRRDHMKVLYWDGDGFAIFYKRLERGAFAARKNLSSPLLRREFLMLLEGVEPKRLQQRFSL